jgi:hypothetical protein
MKKRVVFLGVLAVCLGTIQAFAQESTMGPPKVLMMIREEVKPGRSIAHTLHETGWAHAAVSAGVTTHCLAVSSVTGPTEAWFLFAYPSFAAMEADFEKAEKNAAIKRVMDTYTPKETDFLSDLRTMTARYRPEYSYKPDVNIGEYRYFSINVVRFRLGENVEEFYKALNSARDKANSTSHVLVYSVNSGMPASTFVSFSAVKSMADWDVPNPAMEGAMKEVNFNQLLGKMVLNSETRLYAFSPQMSNVADYVAAASPDFWRPKAATAKKATVTGDKKAVPAKTEK